jgi:hypothetical protein
MPEELVETAGWLLPVVIWSLVTIRISCVFRDYFVKKSFTWGA